MSGISPEVDAHILRLTGDAQEWMVFFVGYMREHHADIDEVISYQMPTYRLGRGKLRNYISFSTATNHFSLHTMDFDLIASLKPTLRKPGKGKGCVTIPYGNHDERALIIDAIERILQRNVHAGHGA